MKISGQYLSSSIILLIPSNCPDILIQLSAIESAIKSLSTIILDE
ncbi:MAG: metal-sensing transcriptional repressor, partial [Acholeplasmatales bacterium]|nr:metal-sensing transcriptional repressor [Acholeplasmatales bacterium]